MWSANVGILGRPESAFLIRAQIDLLRWVRNPRLLSFHREGALFRMGGQLGFRDPLSTPRTGIELDETRKPAETTEP